MAWIGRAFGTSARGTTTHGDKQCQRLASLLHTASSTESALLTTRSRISTHSTSTTTLQHRRWIHSSLKSLKDTPTISSNATNSISSAETTTATAESKSILKVGSHLLRSTYVWTPELDAKVLGMRLEGSTWHEIGAAIGRDHAACHQRYLKELDPALHRQWTSEKIDQLNALVAQGRTWRQISEKLLITQSVCREKWTSMNPDLVEKARDLKRVVRPRKVRPVRESGASPVETYRKVGMLATSKSRWCAHMDALLLELMDRGLNWRQIGSVFGMVPMNCYIRYQHRLRPQLKAGWVPPKIDISNTPYYVLPQRIRPFPTTPKAATTGTETATTTATGGKTGFIPWLKTRQPLPKEASVPQGLLGVLSDDFTYDTRDLDSTKSRAWTPQEDEVISRGRENGASFKTIGEQLKIDPRLCHNRYYTVLDPDLKGKEWTPELIARLRFYTEQGIGWTTISNELGFHRIVCKEKYREITRSLEPSVGPSGTPSSQQQQSGVATASIAASASGGDEDSDMPSESDMEDDQDLEDRDGVMEDDDDYHDPVDEEGDFDDGDDDVDDDGDEDDEDDEDDDAIISMDGSDYSESIGEDDSVTVSSKRSRRRSKPAVPPTAPTVQEIWDQDSYMRERKKLWTTVEETALIRHVIRNGTRGWYEIAESLGGTHSAEECQAYWKYLDMPVVRHDQKPSKWGSQSEAKFWQLWLEMGSNYEEIARTLTEDYYGDADDIRDVSGAPVFEAKDCENLFAMRTRHLLKKDEADGRGGGGEGLNDSQLQKEYVEVALARSKPAPFKWTKEKSVIVQKLTRQRLKTRGVHINWVNWKWVARHVGDGATAQRCSVHWRALRKVELEKDTWTDEDILLLEKGIREVGTFPNLDTAAAVVGMDSESGRYRCGRGEPTMAGYRAIQRFYLPNHNVESLQRKYFLLSDKATEVTVQEYTAIMQAVDEYGEHQWDKVVKHLHSLPSTSTTSRSVHVATGWTKAPCRRVWESSYKHHLLYTPWSATEDLDLRESVEHLGQGDWMLISRFFPGKSSWQCRLRWCQITDPPFQSPVESSQPSTTPSQQQS
ncbi:Myb-like DNA-binding domain protein [Mortierella sp. AD031]|nr:Myb-like DNA-binding domain protein [Mortierella sp. AD031]